MMITARWLKLRWCAALLTAGGCAVPPGRGQAVPPPDRASTGTAAAAKTGRSTADSPAYDPRTGPYEVRVETYEWRDAERDRDVPAKVYYPKSGAGPFPLIVFSHGLGGSRDGYEYLGRHWASHGYVCLHLQHQGSDTEVWRGAGRPMRKMRSAATDPRNALERLRDVHFGIDQMDKLNGQPGPLEDRIDLAHVGMAGHSFGAHTTLGIAGQAALSLRGRNLGNWADPRVKAAIPMSAPVPVDRRHLDEVYRTVRVPCLHMTGTLDNSPIGETKAADRRLPFDHICGADQYLVIFEGGDHMIFSGRRPARPKSQDARFQTLIRMSTTAFWDAYLKNDPRAKAWLANGDFERVLGTEGTFEKKLGEAPAASTPKP